MAYDDLRSFLRALERDGDLKRIKAEVDPYLEVGEIVDRVNKAGGPALLFENVRGSAMPLAMNVYGTDRRMLKALGLSSYDDISEKIAGLLKPELPHGFTGVREAFGKLAGMTHVPPKKVKDAAVQEVVLRGDDVDLDALPALFTWPQDGGSFFNLGLTHTKRPAHRGPQPRPLPAAAARPQARSACTGRSTRTAASTTRRPSGAANGCRWPSPSAARRPSPTRPPRRCPATSTSTCSPASCRAGGSRWWTA